MKHFSIFSGSRPPAAPPPRRRIVPHNPADAHARLLRALADLAGPDARIASSASRPWASATFTGAQHDVMLILEGQDCAGRLAGLAAELPDHEFRIPGHIVADVAVDDVEYGQDSKARIVLKVLTIQDC